MVTWILFLHLLMPIQPPAAATSPVQTHAAQEQASDSGLRHRGVERLFAKFNREAKTPARR